MQAEKNLNDLVNKVKKIQKNLETKLEKSALVKDIKKYAEAQQKVLKKKINSNADLKKVVSYLEKRKKDLDVVAKNLPKEVDAVKKYVAQQKKEFEKMGKKLIQELSNANLQSVKKIAKTAGKKYTSSSATSGTMKKVGRKKMSGKRESSTSV